MHELTCYSDYLTGEPLNYWRSTSGFEVDFILGNHTAIEVKAQANLSPVDLKSLKALAEEQSLKRYQGVSLEPRRRRIGEITVWPYQEFLERLWNGEFA